MFPLIIQDLPIHCVAYTQSSRNDKHNIPVYEPPTQITDDGKILFSHSQFSNSFRIKPYVESINLAYSSNVNIQSTDDYGLHLRYVSSFVKKMHDGCIGEVLYDDNVDARNAAYCYIVSHNPTEPE